MPRNPIVLTFGNYRPSDVTRIKGSVISKVRVVTITDDIIMKVTRDLTETFPGLQPVDDSVRGLILVRSAFKRIVRGEPKLASQVGVDIHYYIHACYITGHAQNLLDEARDATGRDLIDLFVRLLGKDDRHRPRRNLLTHGIIVPLESVLS